MDFRELTKLLFKISGALILVQTVAVMPRYFAPAMQMIQESFSLFFLAMVLPFFVPVLIALFLLFFPGLVTNRLVMPATSDSQETDSLPSVVQLERALLSVLGVYLAYNAISNAFAQLVRYVSYRTAWDTQMSNSPLPPNFISEMYGSLSGVGVEFVVALFLMFGAKGIQSALSRLRR